MVETKNKCDEKRKYPFINRMKLKKTTAKTTVSEIRIG
jgi:hypothetical protein